MRILCQIPPHTGSIDNVATHVYWVGTVANPAHPDDPTAMIIYKSGEVGSIMSSKLKVIPEYDRPTEYAVAKAFTTSVEDLRKSRGQSNGERPLWWSLYDKNDG